MWNSPRDSRIFLFCHSSHFLKGYYCASTTFPTRGFPVALKSLLEPAACLLEIVSHPLNGFFCLICQKNIWNKVAGLGQYNLSAQLPSCLVYPLLLSSSNYLLREAFCLIRYEVNISYSETVILPSLLYLRRLVRHRLHFCVYSPLQVWEIYLFALPAGLLPKPFSTQVQHFCSFSA